jgi:hypothetical protein
MSWLGIILVIVAAYFAFKVAGFVLKLLLWAVVIIGLYWLVAPYLGLPWPIWSPLR